MARTITTTDKKPAPKPDLISVQTLSVFVNNKPGVLARIAQVFSRRGYNIDSLVVSEGRDGQFSRMTIGLSGAPGGLVQIVKQVEKIVDVIHCTEHTPTDAVVRELALVKLKLKSKERADALQILEHFGAKTVDLTETSMIATIHGASDKVDAAVRLLGQFEIVETVRTGKVVMARGEQET